MRSIKKKSCILLILLLGIAMSQTTGGPHTDCLPPSLESIWRSDRQGVSGAWPLSTREGSATAHRFCSQNVVLPAMDHFMSFPFKLYLKHHHQKKISVSSQFKVCFLREVAQDTELTSRLWAPEDSIALLVLPLFGSRL